MRYFNAINAMEFQCSFVKTMVRVSTEMMILGLYFRNSEDSAGKFPDRCDLSLTRLENVLELRLTRQLS